MNSERAAGSTAMPLVSVIIPTYNYGHFVEATIASAAAQDYPALEIIVIDDGSSDDTRARLAARPDITYVHQDNQGLSAARNHGMRLARGAYLQFLDADDLLGAAAIRKRVACLEARPDLAAVFCRSVLFADEAELAGAPGSLREWPQPAAGTIDLALYFANVAPPHAFLVRRAVVAAHALTFDARLRACEDYDFWYRLARVGGPPALCTDTFVYYRQHAASMSRALANQYRHDAEMCRRIRADIRATNTWLGSRTPADYLAALYCASLLACRRLWHVDRTGLTEFVSGHLLPLHQELAVACAAAPPSLAGRLYLADARLLALRLWLRDRALSRPAWRRLAPPGGTRGLAAALLRPAGPRRGPALLRLLQRGLLYAALRGRGWAQRAGRAQAPGAARPADDNPGHDMLA
ncbi:MAG: glycosyltransferase [Gammaproteobacteria bacterium]